MRRFVGALLACALLAGCGGGRGGLRGEGKIAFHSGRDGDGEVFVMNADGSGVTQLTYNDDDDYSPVWSPDGNKIAFQSDRDGDWEIFVMNADGTGVTQLTDNEHVNDWRPRWPGGNMIAFRSNRNHQTDEVFVMKPDGTGVRQLAVYDGADRSSNVVRPWAPDGSMWAIDIAPPGVLDPLLKGTDRDIFVVEGSVQDWTLVYASGFDSVRQITDNDVDDYSPVWSPDGNKIAFASNRSGGDGSVVFDRLGVATPYAIAGLEIFVMNSDGSHVVSLGQKGVPSSWIGLP